MVQKALLPRLLQLNLGKRRLAFAPFLSVCVHFLSLVYTSLPIALHFQHSFITLLVTGLHRYPAYQKHCSSKTAATMLSKSSFIFQALDLHLLALSHLGSSAVVPAQKFPVMPRQINSSSTGVSLPNTTKKFYANALCSPEQEQVEQVAWNDASIYAHALASWHANGSYQAAMDMYMGNDSRGPIGEILAGEYYNPASLWSNAPYANDFLSSSQYSGGGKCPHTVCMA